MTMRACHFLGLLFFVKFSTLVVGGPGDLKRKEIDLKKLAKDFNDDDDDEDIWAPRRKRQEVPCPPEQSSEDLAASLGLEGLPAAPPGSDLDGILRQVSHAQNNQDRGSKGPWPDFDTSDLMARAGLGGGGGSTMKTMSAIFRDGVCPVADEKCANEVARKFSHLLATGGITETMSNALDPWNKVIYVFQGAKIVQMPQVREFLLIQPEVGKVTDDGKDYYPEDIEPPSAEEVAAEKAEKERVKQEKRLAAERAEKRKQERKKKNKKKARKSVNLDADENSEAEL